MMPAARTLRRATVLVAAVLISACGARLSPAQQAKYDAQLNGGPAAPAATGGPGVTPPTDAVPGVTTPTGGAVPTGGVTVPNGPVPGPQTNPTGGASAPVTPGGPSSNSAKGSSTPATAKTYGIDKATGAISIDPAICAKPASGPGISATEIDVGNVSTLTGPIPGIFLGAVHSLQAFATYVNSLGGICGRKLVVKSGDDNLQVSQNAAATQQLSSQVFAFIGSFSADDQGGASVLKANGVPDIGEALSKERFTLPNNFSPEPIAGWNVAPYLFLKKKYGDAITHMAILGANQPTGHATYLNQKAAMQKAGFQFVYDDPNVEPTQTDFSSDAQAMKSAGALGIEWPATAGVMANTAKAIQNAGIDPFPLPLWGTTAYDAAFVQQAGSAANGSVIYLPEALYQGEDASAVPMVGTFNKWYQALYHTPPDEYAMYAWMSGLLFIEGLDKGGALDQKSLLAGLRKVTQFDGGGMVATDNPGAKQPPNCYLFVDIKDGKFVRDPVDPPTGFICDFTPNYLFAN
ncbi:MAG TPA: ABC transporter substrate-binding protein [Mycobacteriales bacterium]|nr:ABC transporter substrate-binding protein [Mycobacteriales bacterium]